MEYKFGRYLSEINTPVDLRGYRIEELDSICRELREFIIDMTSTNPGHLGANLGVIELTVALHYVFNTPEDLLVWDVGHQAYCHKILTGRKDAFLNNRKLGGISGYPRMEESEYDSFGTGHSSTSISAVLGMNIGDMLMGVDEGKNYIAVIGDGALTGGMSFEAINHAGSLGANILVVLNDNGIAIDPNVGALSDYLLDISTSERYNKLKDDIWMILGRMEKGRSARKMIGKLQSMFKSLLLQHSNYFESFNFRYFGPVDGHDVVRLVDVFRDLKNIKGPKLLHVLTTKGKGYEYAERDKTRFHSPGVFDKETGEPIVLNNIINKSRYQDVFGETLVELMEMDSRVVGVTPAMATGCSMNIAMEKFPNRVFDVGIAEQHAVTFSAGLAREGLIPFCNIYSTFAQRGYDQIIHDVALQKLGVVFCFDRAGLVGEDGATHHGSFDLSYMRLVPNVIISAPMNEEELRNLMFTSLKYRNIPFSIRYPRGYGVMTDWRGEMKEMEVGRSKLIKDGEDILVLSIGTVGNMVKSAIEDINKEGLYPSHYNVIFLKPIDEFLLREVLPKYRVVITVEDGTIVGGLGSLIGEYMAENMTGGRLIRLGIPDMFIEHGSQEELYRLCGYDKEGIFNILRSVYENWHKGVV